jgi:hypothetical protein
MPKRLQIAVALAFALFAATRAWSFERHDLSLSLEAGYGRQENFGDRSYQSNLVMWNSGARVGWVPLGTTGSGIFKGALQLSLQVFLQNYLPPHRAYLLGPMGLARYNFQWRRRLLPYLELGGAAAATNLDIFEINSRHTFMGLVGAGASFFVTRRIALNAGYRLQHVSNGNTAIPNRGFEAHQATVGLTYWFLHEPR